MGAGASSGGAPFSDGKGTVSDGKAGDPALTSIADVLVAHQQDRFRCALDRHQQLLAREQKHCRLLGYESSSRYHQPLMKDKLESTVCLMDDLGASYGRDHRRHHDFSQVHESALDDGPVRAMCALADSASVVCASSAGPLWVYNWREGRAVSRMRVAPEGDRAGARGRPNCKGRVLRMSPFGSDAGFLATGDELGRLALWNLAGPFCETEVRLHQGEVTGVRPDPASDALFTTGGDSYVLLFDVHAQRLLARGRPRSCSCGDGIPNTVLELGQSGKQIFVGGVDGKLRVWTKDDRGLQRQCSLGCSGSKPTQCAVAADGWRLVVATCPAEDIHCGYEPGSGGLHVFDTRRLGADGRSALVAEHMAPSDRWAYGGGDGVCAQGGPQGVIDMALFEEHGESLALCLMGGGLSAFDLRRAATAAPPEAPAAEGLASYAVVAPEFDFDIVARPDGGCGRPSEPCAILTMGHLVLTASTAPSLSVWRRPPAGEDAGHSDYDGSIKDPFVLCARCVAFETPAALHGDQARLPTAHRC
mmetsp:Transcript_40266/g.116399  ORF Transcript_40266/g.116399 Transcript_40266/m.116399 type:complete len:532 (-) Transcript_40266:15-1610(-)